MSKAVNILKPLMPIFAAVYGLALIYVTALPSANGVQNFRSEFLSWIITLVGIAMTVFLVKNVEPRIFPTAKRFSLKFPTIPIASCLLLIAPLWFVVQEYILYGFVSLMHTVTLEPISYTADELREDLLASVHAVLLAPVLEELCYRQLAISPFSRRGAQVVVCIVMALLFAILHVRNAPSAFLGALFYGVMFIWSRNIWYGILVHAGSNLTVTLLSIYSAFGIGNLQMTKTPSIILPDTNVVVATLVLAVVGLLLVRKKR